MSAATVAVFEEHGLYKTGCVAISGISGIGWSSMAYNPNPISNTSWISIFTSTCNFQYLTDSFFSDQAGSNGCVKGDAGIYSARWSFSGVSPPSGNGQVDSTYKLYSDTTCTKLVATDSPPTYLAPGNVATTYCFPIQGVPTIGWGTITENPVQGGKFFYAYSYDCKTANLQASFFSTQAGKSGCIVSGKWSAQFAIVDAATHTVSLNSMLLILLFIVYTLLVL